MRIALVHPVFWPEVRRGSERVLHDIGAGMAARGHEVSLITTHPGPASESIEDGIRVLRAHRPPPVPGLGLHELFLETVPGTVRRLREGGFDLAHAFHLTAAFAAVEARSRNGPPVVYSFHGIPTRRYLVARRRRIEMLRRVLAGSERTTVLSRAAADGMRRYLFHDPEVMPAGVDLQGFAPAPERLPEPTILCTATFTDPRKRIPLLLDAFRLLRERRPEATLLLDDNPDPTMRSLRPELPEGAQWVQLSSDGSLADAYARAWVTALPSVEEAQGLVLLESLAAGTPVVAARSGGPPDVLDGRPAVGRLFEPDDAESLSRALEEALALAEDPATASVCEARAADFGWDALLDSHADLYEAVIGNG
jgi:glycosyltransferase involved in cell wall biosynthesis